MYYKFVISLFIFSFLITPVNGQPFDLMIPRKEHQDTLTGELRALQAIERDMAIERLTKKPRRAQTYVDLAELRLSQGKLIEAERFFKMALELEPKSYRANRGLVMTYYRLSRFGKAKDIMGRFHRFHPVSESLRYELETMRRNLQPEYQAGVTIREDDRGLLDIVSSVEGYFPGKHYKKLAGRYRFENWSYEDNGEKATTNVYSATFEYDLDKNSGIAFKLAPEVYKNNKTINAYSFQAIAGSDNLKFSAQLGKNPFKDNIYTVKNSYHKDFKRFGLTGKLHERTRIAQTAAFSNISDSNTKARYDTEIIHFIFYKGRPLLSTKVNYYHIAYEKQKSDDQNNLKYWAPSDYSAKELTLSWETRAGLRWWWGLETSLRKSNYRFIKPTTFKDTGFGAKAHLSYEFDRGTLYTAFGERLHEYFRERKAQLYMVFRF